MDKMYYAKKYTEVFPEYTNELNEHINSYGELLAHVFFGDIINQHLVELLTEEVDICRIIKIFDFINEMYQNGEEDVKNVVEVTILEYLGDDPLILEKAFKYISDELKETSNDIEDLLGRSSSSPWNVFR